MMNLSPDLICYEILSRTSSRQSLIETIRALVPCHSLDEAKVKHIHSRYNRFYFLVSSSNKSIQVWDVINGSKTSIPVKPDVDIRTMCCSPDGRYIAHSGERSKNVYVREIETGLLKHEFEHPKSYACITSLSYSPDGRYIAAGKMDGTIVIYDTIPFAPAQSIDAHGIAPVHICFSPDGNSLVSGCTLDTTSIRIWDFHSGKDKGLISLQHSVLSICMSPDGSSIASGHYSITSLDRNNEGIIIRDSSSHNIIHSIPSFESRDARFLTFSPNSRFLISSSESGKIRIYSHKTGKLVKSLDTMMGGGISSLSCSKDSRYLASSHFGSGAIRIWDLTTFELVKTLQGDQSTIISLSFLP